MARAQIFVWIAFYVVLTNACVTNDDCNNRGVCKNNECDCDPAYMKPDCTYWPYKVNFGYTIYFYPMSFGAFVLWVASFYRLYQFRVAFRSFEKWKDEFSVRHLAIIMIWIATLARNIYNGVNLDRNWMRNQSSFFPVLFFIFYPCIAVAFTCELLVWVELYTATTLQNIEKLPKYRKFLIIFNCVVFPTEIALRFAIFLQPHVYVLQVTWFVFLGILVITETFGFVVVGTLLLLKVKGMTALTGQQKQKAAFSKLTASLLVQTFIIVAACIVIAVGGAQYDRPETFFAVNVVARILEYLAVVFILVIIRPQTDRRNASSSTQGVSLEHVPSHSTPVSLSNMGEASKSSESEKSHSITDEEHM